MSFPFFFIWDRKLDSTRRENVGFGSALMMSKFYSEFVMNAKDRKEIKVIGSLFCTRYLDD